MYIAYGASSLVKWVANSFYLVIFNWFLHICSLFACFGFIVFCFNQQVSFFYIFSSFLWDQWKACNFSTTSDFPLQDDTLTGSHVQIPTSLQVCLPISIVLYFLFHVLKTISVTISYLFFLVRSHINIPNQFFSID